MVLNASNSSNLEQLALNGLRWEWKTSWEMSTSGWLLALVLLARAANWVLYVCALATDFIKQHSRHHREPRGETHERCLRSGRREEDADVHGRLQHAGEGRVRLATAAGTDPTLVGLRILVRQSATDHQIHPRMFRLSLVVFHVYLLIASYG